MIGRRGKERSVIRLKSVNNDISISRLIVKCLCIYCSIIYSKKSVASLKNNDVIGCFFVNGLYIYQDDKYFLDEGSESMDKNSCTF